MLQPKKPHTHVYVSNGNSVSGPHNILYENGREILGGRKGSIRKSRSIRKSYGGGCHQNTLCTWMKLSKNKFFFFKKIAECSWPRRVDDYYYQTERI